MIGHILPMSEIQNTDAGLQLASSSFYFSSAMEPSRWDGVTLIQGGSFFRETCLKASSEVCPEVRLLGDSSSSQNDGDSSLPLSKEKWAVLRCHVQKPNSIYL